MGDMNYIKYQIAEKLSFSPFEGPCRPNGICKKTATKCNQTSVISCEFSFLKILIRSRNTGYMNFDLYKISRESYFFAICAVLKAKWLVVEVGFGLSGSD